MDKIRSVTSYEGHFEKFLNSLDQKTQDKVFKLIEMLETIERIPSNHLKSITGVKGLFEGRIKLGSNIWRVFCFFDGNKLVILLNGFQKKSQKTPKKEIEKAKKLMLQYFKEKKDGKD